MRYIFIIGSTETLEYFSLQLAECFRQLGRDIFIWDMRHPVTSAEAFEALHDVSGSTLITFNFIGMSGEGQFLTEVTQEREYIPRQLTIWEVHDIPIYSIMVDSPIYYYKQLTMGIQNLKLVCIDDNHKRYVEREYPEYGEVLFLPLAGNLAYETLWKDRGDSFFPVTFQQVPIKERPIDVIFIGNYVPIESLMPSIEGLGEEYQEWLLQTAEYMIEHPEENMEDGLLAILKEEIPDGADEEYREAMHHMVFVDLYVRSIYRGQIVSALADAGIKVYCTGKDWDKAPCKHPENLIHTDASITSLECVRALQQAKISLNVMPWFKAGAHDRIFSSMLAGCVCVTDSSAYLDDILVDGENAIIYPLLSPQESGQICAERIKSLLGDVQKMQHIAEAGRQVAMAEHLWKHRGERILSYVENN